MKKAFAVLTALAMAFALASCDGAKPADAASNAESAASEIASVIESIVSEAGDTASVISVIPVPVISDIEPAGNSSDNIALTATPIDCGADVYGADAGEPHSASYLNDGNTEGPGYQPAGYQDGDWAGLELAEAAKIDMIVLYWEHGDYVSSYADGGYEIELITDGEEFAAFDGFAVDEKVSGEHGRIDTLTFTEPVSASAVKVVFRDGKVEDHKYAPQLFEIEVYAAEETAETETSEDEASEAGTAETENED